MNGKIDVKGNMKKGKTEMFNKKKNYHPVYQAV